MKKIVIFLFVVAAMSCNHRNRKSQKLEKGDWRAVLIRQDGVKIPFNFSVNDSGTVMTIANGKGRMKVNQIRYNGDSVQIHMPFFNSDFHVKIQSDGSLKGFWVKHYPDTNKMLSFRAFPNTDYRIMKNPAPPSVQVTGKWSSRFFATGSKDSGKAIGEFHQEGNRLTGTFLSETGDYGYLEGVVSGDSLYLSSFNGSHIFLFRARVQENKKRIEGVFYSGFEDYEHWEGFKDKSAKLPNPFGITGYKPGEARLRFSFPDIHGDTVTLPGKIFQNKVVIVQILGSWCPNCMDETRFLSRWYQQNRMRGVAVVGLAYERSANFDQAVKGVLTFKKRFDVQYPLLITGVAANDPHLMEKTLPQLLHFISFPTTIFLDKKGDIAKIHAGFSGPGTGAHFIAYKKEFNHIVDSLLQE